MSAEQSAQGLDRCFGLRFSRRLDQRAQHAEHLEDAVGFDDPVDDGVEI